MYQTILIPYDGSEEAEKGAAHGLELAAALDADVHGLYVIDLPGTPRALSIRDDEEQMRTEYREYGEGILADLGDLAADHGVGYASSIRSGSPGEEIVDCADEEGLDAIVMGSAYRGKIGGILGGTMDKVVRTATVPVITQRMRIDEV
jgi:nucleotide-binding universal stress UspA family protein